MTDNNDTKNVESINGPTHLGSGDINITLNKIQGDMARLLDLVKDIPEATSLISGIMLSQASLSGKLNEFTIRNGEMQKASDKRGTMKLDPATRAYIHTDEQGNKMHCCPYCWGRDEKIFPLQKIDEYCWHCQECNKNLLPDGKRKFTGVAVNPGNYDWFTGEND